MVGLRFDTIIVLWILLPLLLALPWLPLKAAVVRWTSRLYLTATLALCLLLLLVDARFYDSLDTHLNFLAYEYFNQGTTFWHLILSDPMLYPFMIGWLIAAVLIWWWIGKLLRRAAEIPLRPKWFAYPVWFVIAFALTFLGIRGRTGLSPIGWSVAYISDNHFVNQLGLNGVYTLGRATMEEGNDPRLSYLPESERFPFIPLSAGIDTVQAMLGQPNDRWLEPGKSLLRETTQPPPPWGFKANVVIVLMESWSARLTGCLMSPLVNSRVLDPIKFPTDLTPHFDSLATQGILFVQFYANGVRSSYGIAATLGSFPALPGRSIMTRYNASHPFVTLSEILHERGYENIFAYGGDIVFDNMKGFLTTKKYDRLLDDGYFGKKNVFAKWGVPDHIVFDRLVTMIDTLPRPFNLTVFTLSNHEPFDLPDSSVQKYQDNSEQSRLYNVQLYADWAIGRFVRQFKEHSAFDSTIFVFVSDHTKRGEDRYLLDPLGFQIPLLIYSPKLVGEKGRCDHTTGGQIDIVPTLMSVLGGTYLHASWGKNILSDSDFPDSNDFAFLNDAAYGGMMYSYQYAWTDDFHSRTSLRIQLLNATDNSQLHPDKAALLKRRLRIFFQVADQLSSPRPTVGQ